MTIKMVIDIGLAAPGPKNEFGVGVTVYTDGIERGKTPDVEGATWVGICMAINAYMRSRGVHGFDCMKPHIPQ